MTIISLKFVFARETVTFAGFQITMSSVRLTPEFLISIQDFLTPGTITDVRAWCGLLNQAAYAFSSAQHLLPFRELMKPDVDFNWTDELDQLLEASKSVIIKEIEKGVCIFEKSRPTCLSTDWSKSGIGYWLSQKHCKCPSVTPLCCKSGWKITLIGSRFTRGAECQYAPIEGEALAVVVALDKTRYFVLGCSNLIIAVDHKPLLKIFTDRSLNDIPNTRLQNLKEKTLRYRFDIIHIPGTKNKAADAMSRYPSSASDDPMLHLEDDVAAINIGDSRQTPSMHDFLSSIRCDEQIDTSVDEQVLSTAIAALNSIEATTWNRVKLETNSDENMIQLISIIEDGFPPNRNDMPPELQEYHQFREHLSSIDSVVLYKDRVVIPPSLRPSVIDALHAAHHCITSMTARAETSVFWPCSRPPSNDCAQRAPIANGMHHHSRVHHPFHLSSLGIPSNAGPAEAYLNWCGRVN